MIGARSLSSIQKGISLHAKWHIRVDWDTYDTEGVRNNVRANVFVIRYENPFVCKTTVWLAVGSGVSVRYLFTRVYSNGALI
jgi:hypothetical protein